MVQFFQTGPSRKALAREALGESLGKGLANLSRSYFANKSLQGVLDDPKLKDAPLSERLGALQQALEPHGEYGMGILQKRLGIEQQRMQEQQNKLASKFYRGDELSQEEKNQLPPEAILQYEKAKTERLKALKPPGGLTGQGVPLEVSQAIPPILNANKEATADELAVALDQAGIPRAYSNSYIENRRRQDEAKAGMLGKKTELAFKRDEKLLEERDKSRQALPLLDASLDAMRDAIEEGNLGFFSPDNIAELTGLEWLRSAKGGQFKAASKNFFVNNVQKFGGRPNQFIEMQVEKMLPKMGRDKPANLTGLELLQFEQDVKKKQIEILDQEEDKGFDPGKLSRSVDKRMKEYVEQRQLQLANRLREIDKMEKKKDSDKPSKGEILIEYQGQRGYVPIEEINAALKAGAKRL